MPPAAAPTLYLFCLWGQPSRESPSLGTRPAAGTCVRGQGGLHAPPGAPQDQQGYSTRCGRPSGPTPRTISATVLRHAGSPEQRQRAQGLGSCSQPVSCLPAGRLSLPICDLPPPTYGCQRACSATGSGDATPHSAGKSSQRTGATAESSEEWMDIYI